jgi:hypothetical protein
MQVSFFSVLFYLNRLLPLSCIGAWRLNQLFKHVLRMLHFKHTMDQVPEIQGTWVLMPYQLAMLDPEDEDTAVLPKVSNCLPVKMVQHPRSLEYSATLL